jgi:uncharacterized protein YydD (DUF2326 family)
MLEKDYLDWAKRAQESSKRLAEMNDAYRTLVNKQTLEELRNLRIVAQSVTEYEWNEVQNQKQMLDPRHTLQKYPTKKRHTVI